MSENDEFQVRNVGMICPYEGTRIWVDHIWETRPREDGHPDDGDLGLMVKLAGRAWRRS